MKTSMPTLASPRWVLVDAEGQSLGRLAAHVAFMLRGKHTAAFAPHRISNDHIIVINVGKLAIPGSKFHRKVYYRHTGYPGNLRVQSLKEAFTKDPSWVLQHAVKGMLPGNRLRVAALRRLHVYAGSDHEYAAQKPVSLPLSRP